MSILSGIAISPWVPGSDEDVASIAHLFGELGYPTEAEAIAPRLTRLEANRMSMPIELLVAREGEGGEIVGFAFVSALALSLEMDLTAEILALVVDSRYRGNRIGQLLVEAAESWAAAHDAFAIRVRTNVTRSDAHRFYERVGFEHTKTSRMYVKPISSDIKD